MRKLCCAAHLESVCVTSLLRDGIPVEIGIFFKNRLQKERLGDKYVARRQEPLLRHKVNDKFHGLAAFNLAEIPLNDPEMYGFVLLDDEPICRHMESFTEFEHPEYHNSEFQ